MVKMREKIEEMERLNIEMLNAFKSMLNAVQQEDDLIEQQYQQQQQQQIYVKEKAGEIKGIRFAEKLLPEEMLMESTTDEIKAYMTRLRTARHRAEKAGETKKVEIIEENLKRMKLENKRKKAEARG
jgi:hypothetical protein